MHAKSDAQIGWSENLEPSYKILELSRRLELDWVRSKRVLGLEDPLRDKS